MLKLIYVTNLKLDNTDIPCRHSAFPFLMRGNDDDPDYQLLLNKLHYFPLFQSCISPVPRIVKMRASKVNIPIVM